jgi:hypothetical protein
MKPNTDRTSPEDTTAARPLTVGELVEHTYSRNHGFVRSVEPDGTYTVEFSGPLVNAGYHRDELQPTAARHYVVTLDLDLGTHLRTAKHLVCATSEAEAEELAIRAESCTRKDDTPPDEDDRYEDGSFLYAVESITPVAPEHVAILKRYL